MIVLSFHGYDGNVVKEELGQVGLQMMSSKAKMEDQFLAASLATLSFIIRVHSLDTPKTLTLNMRKYEILQVENVHVHL